jgi:hypothetical protein
MSGDTQITIAGTLVERHGAGLIWVSLSEVDPLRYATCSLNKGTQVVADAPCAFGPMAPNNSEWHGASLSGPRVIEEASTSLIGVAPLECRLYSLESGL